MIMLFVWDYDHVRGGAVVSAVPPDGKPVELGHVNNGNVAQILCHALAAQHTGVPFAPRVGRNDGDASAMLTWLGYVNPSPREDPTRGVHRV